MTRHPKTSSAKDTMVNARKLRRIDGPTTDMPATHHLLVGFDRCPSSQQALRFANTLAAPLNAHLHVAHIIDLEDFPIDPDGDDWEQRFADELAQERAQACDLLGALPGNWTYSAHHGGPAHTLTTLAEADDALMIIIGAARGGMMSSLDRAVGVSVSAHLIRHTRCPVLVVPDATGPAKAVE
jgi:nucleotide-binding universal stress UspA family protein